jgi:vacuolar-type H+-ATPase subunit D/Vma8
LPKDLLTRLTEEVLGNETLSQALGLAMRKGIETKGKIDRNVQTVLQLLNLPTRADLARLQTKLEVIQGSLVNLSLKVDRLLAEREQVARRAARKRAGAESDGDE